MRWEEETSVVSKRTCLRKEREEYPACNVADSGSSWHVYTWYNFKSDVPVHAEGARPQLASVINLTHKQE